MTESPASIFYIFSQNENKNLKSLMTSFEETKCISVGFSCQDIFCVNEGWIFVFCKEKKIEEQKSTLTSTMGLKKKFFCSNRIICIAVQNFTKYLCFDFFIFLFPMIKNQCIDNDIDIVRKYFFQNYCAYYSNFYVKTSKYFDEIDSWRIIFSKIIY